MNSQPPILDTTGSSLPGPQFIPRPGWGGQLNRWFSANTRVVVVRVFILLALVLIARSMREGNPVPTPQPSNTVSPLAQSLRPLSIPVRAGDGMTSVAARALDLYTALQSPVIRLDSAQHLFAVDTLTRSTVCPCPLKVHQEIVFAPADIASAIDRALKLTPSQHKAWGRLVR